MDKIFVLDNVNIGLDKKYFFRADGQGNFPSMMWISVKTDLNAFSYILPLDFIHFCLNKNKKISWLFAAAKLHILHKLQR